MRPGDQPQTAVSPRALPADALHGVGGGVQVTAEVEAAVVEVGPGRVATAEPAAGPKASRRGHWVGWTAAMVTIGAMIGLIIVAGMKFLNDPVEATTKKTLAQKQAGVVSAKPETNQVAGLFIELTYPGLFDQVSQSKQDARTEEQYMITSKGNYRRTIALSVRMLPSNNLDDDSGYRFRQINPGDYTETKVTLRGETAILMSKADKTEQTLFWVHKGHDLNLAITSTVPEDSVEEFMKAIMPTLRWRQ